jgi:hypothetical protein
MSNRRNTAPSGAVAEAPISREELDDLHGRTRFPPQEQGECPYCHHGLERREIKISENHDFIGRQSLRTLLVFWGCTNEGCSLMFHQRPRIQPPPGKHRKH